MRLCHVPNRCSQYPVVSVVIDQLAEFTFGRQIVTVREEYVGCIGIIIKSCTYSIIVPCSHVVQTFQIAVIVTIDGLPTFGMAVEVVRKPAMELVLCNRDDGYLQRNPEDTT